MKKLKPHGLTMAPPAITEEQIPDTRQPGRPRTRTRRLRGVKITILSVVLILASASFFFGKKYLFEKQVFTKEEGLSKRAQDYLAKQQQEEDEFWGYVDFEKEKGKNKVLGIKTIKEEGCFSFDIPFEISNLRNKEDECNYFLATENPKGQVYLYRKKVTVTNLKDEPGVSFRLKKTASYQKGEELIGGIKFLTFKNNDVNHFEKIAFYLTGNDLFVLSLIAYTPDDISDKFTQALSSISFEPN